MDLKSQIIVLDSILDEISKANQFDVPIILLKLQDILVIKSNESQIRKEIFERELISILCVCLKQDLSKLKDSWIRIKTLSQIAVSICIGLNSLNLPKFKDNVLPDVLESCLMAANRLQKKFINTPAVLEEQRSNLLQYFIDVIDSISLLLSAYDVLTFKVLRSAWFFSMVLTDGVKISLRIMSFVQSMARIKIDLFEKIEPKISTQLLDELVFKISDSNSEEIIIGAAKTILDMCKSGPALAYIVASRYKGLKILLQKWKESPFISKLEDIVQTGDMTRAEARRMIDSVKLIQRWWRGFLVRRMLKKTNKSIAKFQASFRKKMVIQKKTQEDEKNKNELKYMLVIKHRYNMRLLHHKQLKALDVLPANKIESYFAEQRTKSAIIIQNAWRNYASRKCFSKLINDSNKKKAAILIQRHVRRWLYKRKKTVTSLKANEPTIDQKKEIQLQILEKRQNRSYKSRMMSFEEQKAIHEKAMYLLQEHISGLKDLRNKTEHREALLGMLSDHSQLLLNAPSLKEANPNDLSVYFSRIGAICESATKEHHRMLRIYELPSWKRNLIIDSEYGDVDFNEHCDLQE